jgi:hypothetical protein
MQHAVQAPADRKPIGGRIEMDVTSPDSARKLQQALYEIGRELLVIL